MKRKYGARSLTLGASLVFGGAAGGCDAALGLGSLKDGPPPDASLQSGDAGGAPETGSDAPATSVPDAAGDVAQAPEGGAPACDGGACACAAPFTLCPSGCVDETNDSQHCGSCAAACGAGQACVASACVCDTSSGCSGCCGAGATCEASGFPNCGTGGVTCAVCDPATSNQCSPSGTCVCGSTGTSCGVATACVGGTCLGSPTVTLVSPNVGSAAGGNVLSLQGTNFISGMTVTVGSAAAVAATVSSSTSATFVLPAYPGGVGGTSTAQSVTVNTGAGTASLTTLYYYPSAYLAHWRADVGFGTSGSATSWDDQSTNGFTLTTSGAAPAVSSDYNGAGLQALSFTAQSLRSTTLSQLSPASVVAVAAVHLQTTQVLLSNVGSAMAVNGSTHAFYINDTVPNNLVWGTAATPDVPYDVLGVWNGASSTIAVDNGTPLVGTLGAVTVGNPLSIGLGWNGVIAEVMIYPRALSGAEWATIHTIHKAVWHLSD